MSNDGIVSVLRTREVTVFVSQWSTVVVSEDRSDGGWDAVEYGIVSGRFFAAMDVSGELAEDAAKDRIKEIAGGR